MKTLLKRIIQISAGLLFVFSGLAKAFDTQSFAVLIANYGAAWAGYAAPLICGIEVILGLFLIFDIKSKSTALIVGIITVFFSLAFTFAFFYKGIEDCGCMGSFKILTIPPIVSFTRNLLIIIGCYWIWKYTDDRKTEVSNLQIWIVSTLSALTFCLAGYSLGVSIIDKNDIHVGDQINVNQLHYYDEIISKGTSLVFIFNPDCSHCWNATENVKSIKRIPEYSNLIGVTMYGDTAEYMTKMKPNFQVYQYPTSELSEIVSEVPVLLILKDGRIERIFKSDKIPSGPMLLKMLAK